MNDLILWFNSPPEYQLYPEKAANNHHWYRTQAHKYLYDENKSILYKIIKNSDGIGE